jgi:hypothetical protein
LTKVGFSQDAPNRIYIANLEGYAGRQNWRIRASLYSLNAGQIELAVHRALRGYSATHIWERNGVPLSSKEVFHCTFEAARDALISVITPAEAALIEES